MIDRPSGLRINEQNVDSMQLDGEAVLLNLSTHAYFGLNVTGTQVWELIREQPGISLDDLTTVLAQRHAADPTLIGGDVASLIDAMTEHGLVVGCDGSRPAAAAVPAGEANYEPPVLQAYGNLDTLILSGE